MGGRVSTAAPAPAEANRDWPRGRSRLTRVLVELHKQFVAQQSGEPDHRWRYDKPLNERRPELIDDNWPPVPVPYEVPDRVRRAGKAPASPSTEVNAALVSMREVIGLLPDLCAIITTFAVPPRTFTSPVAHVSVRVLIDRRAGLQRCRGIGTALTRSSLSRTLMGAAVVFYALPRT